MREFIIWDPCVLRVIRRTNENPTVRGYIRCVCKIRRWKFLGRWKSGIERQLKWVSRIFGIHIQESMVRVRDHGE